jgi:hypothetical protein
VDGHPLPVKAALAPGHILVCWDEPGAAPIYVEMLERGAVVERSKLLDEFNTRPDYTGPYFKPDSAAVISSELMTCAVGLGSRDQARALQYFAWATELCPGNIEAYQNAAGMHFMQARQEEPATAHVSFERGSALLDAAWQQERSRSLELVRVNNLLSFATRWPAAERTPFFDRALRALDAADSVHFDTRGAKDRHWIGDNSVALRRGEILEQRFILSADPRDLERALAVYSEAERRVRAAEKPLDLRDGRDAARSSSATSEDNAREWQTYADKQIGLLAERRGRVLLSLYATSKDTTYARQALVLLAEAQKDLVGPDQNRAKLAHGYLALKLGDSDTARTDFTSALQVFKKDGNSTVQLEDLAVDGAIKDTAFLRILLVISQDQHARSLANEILATK